MYVSEQEHDGIPLTSLHCEYGPHGDGMQGFLGGTIAGGNCSANVRSIRWWQCCAPLRGRGAETYVELSNIS